MRWTEKRSDKLRRPGRPRKPQTRVVPEGFCASHRRPKPCQSCASGAAKHRAYWQDPKWRAKWRVGMEMKEIAWTDEEREVVRTMAGEHSSREIADKVNELRQANGLKPRTAQAIESWAESHGVVLWRNENVISRAELSGLLAIDYKGITTWQRMGWIVNKPRADHITVFTREEVERCLRERPWLVNPKSVKPGSFRTLVEAVTHRDPWLTTREMSKITGIAVGVIRDYARRGYLDAVRMPWAGSQWKMRASMARTITELYERNRPGPKRESVAA